MPFYAHSTGMADKSDWQLLTDHLEGAARLAREFADVFGAGRYAYISALIHDFGKYQEEFQRRLEGQDIQVEHAALGAQWAYRLYGKPGLFMALAIAGHHGRLSDVTGIEGNTRPGSFEAVLARVFPEIKPEVELPPMPPEPVFDDKYPGFSMAFFARMLYSSLCDADCLDTERFYDPQKYERRGRVPGISELLDRLARHYEKLAAAPTDINRARAAILERCLEMSFQPRGFFSLTAPTGSGKTLSSLSFALNHAWAHKLRRVIYTMPFTSIIEQNADVFRKALGRDAVLEYHSRFDSVFEADLEDDIVTGDYRLAAENWDKPVIVTTNLEFFESLFSAHKKRCRKLHNIADSVIILDEAQAMPAGYLRPFMAALRELVRAYGCTCVLCTATQPIPKQGKWRKLLSVEPEEITGDPGEFADAFDRVEIRYDVKHTLEDERLAMKLLGHDQALCILNTRKHAKALAMRLERFEGVYHLSACMTPLHRKKVLDEVRSRVRSGKTCRVISTHMVEAGVDIDFPVVYRAIAGLDSIAQAAGRCNREGKRPGKGLFRVFKPEPHGALDRGWMYQTRALFEDILRNENREDILSIPSIDNYFERLYNDGTAGQLDKFGLMESNAGACGGKFPFPDWDRKVRLLDDDNYTVIVPWGVSKKKWSRLLRRMESSPDVSLLRELQPLTVQITPWDFKAMTNSRKIVLKGKYFWVLEHKASYSARYGLKRAEDDGGMIFA